MANRKWQMNVQTSEDVMSLPYAPIAWIFFVAMLSLTGCSRNATVTGKVTYKDRTVRHGSVVFLGADNIARSGVIESDGSYRVEEVFPGNVRIGVISRDPAKGRVQLDKKNAVEDWFPLPRDLENPATSRLGCTVGPGRTGYDIELK
jgi:hypothetical protein